MTCVTFIYVFCFFIHQNLWRVVPFTLCVKVVSREVWIWEAKRQKVPEKWSARKMELYQKHKCHWTPVGAHVHTGLSPAAKASQGGCQKARASCSLLLSPGKVVPQVVLPVTQDAAGVGRPWRCTCEPGLLWPGPP